MPKKPTKMRAELAGVRAEAGLLHRIISVVSTAETLDSAFKEVLREMCNAIGWTYGEVWIPHASKAYLEVSPAWYASTDHIEIFRKRSESIRFDTGIGLPGRAWETRAPVWVRDVTQDANFPRWPEALVCDLKTGLALPVFAGREVVAVLNLFTTENMDEDTQLIELVSSVAVQLGLLIRCLSAEAARAQSERDFQCLFNNARAAILIFEPKYQIILDINQAACELYGFSRSDFIGLSMETLSRGIAHDRSFINKALDKGQMLNFETVHFHHSGAELFLKTDISVVNYQGKQAILTINREIIKQE
jgi:PAS domain S-box-containing protein